MVVLLVDPAADTQHDDYIGQHQQVKPDGGNGGLNDDFSEIADEQVHRVEQEEIAHHGRIIVDGVENGGHIHQQLGKHTPQVLDIPEKDKEGRKDQPHPDVEQDQHTDGVKQADKLPGESNIVQNTKHEKHAEGQVKVDKGLNVFGKQKQVLGYVDLGENPGIAHQRGHALAGRLVEVGEHQVTAE